MIAERYPQEAWIYVYTDGSSTNAVTNGEEYWSTSREDRKPQHACAAPTTVHKQKLSCTLPPQCTLQMMAASRLTSSLVPSLSCRHIKTTSSQTRPKPYNKFQLPGGLFFSGFETTVEYQEMSKRTSLQKTVPEGYSITTMSAAAKRRLSSERS